jgi:uncharacterized membrane protein YdjX (TVP38/TMEM64 family)
VISLAGALLLACSAKMAGVNALMEQVISDLRGRGAPLFFISMAILPAIGFPLLPFALLAGPTFSPIFGTGGVAALAILAVCTNVTLSYVLASTVLRPPVQWLVTRLGYRLPDPARYNPWLLSLLTRVAPGPPFWMQSYTLGLVRVRFAPYVVVSTTVPAGYLTGAIMFGDAIHHGKAGTAIFAVGLLLLIGVGVYFLRKKLTAPTCDPAPTFSPPSPPPGP